MFILDSNATKALEADIKILTAFQKTKIVKTKKETEASIDHWVDKTLKEEFNQLKSAKNFTAAKDEVLTFTGLFGETVKVVGLGDKAKYKSEDLRKTTAKIYKSCKAEKAASISFDLNGFNLFRSTEVTAKLIAESVGMTNYHYDKYLSKKSNNTIKTIYLSNFDKKSEVKINKTLGSVKNVVESINFMKDLINEAPNFLHSVEYAKRIEADTKKNLKRVKVKILNKAEIKKENMNLFLSVNSGSAYEPRLVHLTYEPAKSTSKTKHVALVGKGITFDTGGYSLKPGPSMAGMKNDMAGSATLYGAFRTAVLENAPVKISLILAMTDNAVNSFATFPDAIVTGRNGKSVEILNTDAEGRLILADALDYACDLNPNYIIDAATLTGACLVALGNQVAAILGNDQKWIEEILKISQKNDEYMWQLPIIEEWRHDIKSKVADLKNIGTPMRAGTAIGAAFLEEFIKNDVKWAHLDVAGVVDTQTHLPYCQAHGASGLLVRSLSDLLING